MIALCFFSPASHPHASHHPLRSSRSKFLPHHRNVTSFLYFFSSPSPLIPAAISETHSSPATFSLFFQPRSTRHTHLAHSHAAVALGTCPIETRPPLSRPPPHHPPTLGRGWAPSDSAMPMTHAVPQFAAQRCATAYFLMHR